MLVACCSSTYYLAFTYKLKYSWLRGCEIVESPWLTDYFQTRCRARWLRSRWCAWAQVGVRRRLTPLLCVFPWWSVVVPSWGDRGPCRMWGLIFYFGTVVGPWVYWMIVMLFMYLCDVASVSQLCIIFPYYLFTWVVVKITLLATLLSMRLCL